MPPRPFVVAGRLLLAAIALVASTALAGSAPDLAPDAALAAFFEREWQWSLAEYPEFATQLGDHRYDDRLTDRSFAAIARRKAHRRDVVAALERFDPQTLGRQDRISRALMLEDQRLAMRVDALYGPLPFSGLGGFAPVNPMDGPQFALPSLAKATRFASTADYEAYLARLAAVPRAIDDTIAIMREGMRTGWMPPRVTMARVPGQLDALIVDADRNPLFRPFLEFDPRIAPADRERLAAAGRAAIPDVVVPAFASLRRFVVDEYVPKCPDALAATALPGGAPYYALAVRESTTTDKTPAEIHAIGLAEVARIGGEMDAVIARLGFTGTRAEFFAAQRADPRSFLADSDDLLRGYRDIAKRVDAQLPSLFAELPRLPYGVRAMDAFEGDNAEHYTPGAADGSRAGYFEANVLHVDRRPRYDMESLFLHEAVPGHHLQIARAQEMGGLPAFRRNNWYVAYGEGWALYAESLGSSLGLYTEPRARLSALAAEIMRAARLVVDTGLHTLGWTRERAVRYMIDNAAIADGFANAEVDRYIVWPGQALGYKIGELEIKRLRDRAQAALGPRFDLRRFHNAVLDDGALPLTLLAERIDGWIDDESHRESR